MCTLLEEQALKGGVERSKYTSTPVTPVSLQTTTQVPHQVPFYLDPK